MEELLTPDHAGERLAHDAVILGGGFWEQGVIKDVGLGYTRREDPLTLAER
jgi:hypothetical protein